MIRHEKTHKGIHSAIDYYPFGMEMPKRIKGDTSYRFGFNGQMQDNEFVGKDGTHLDFGFREYDSRIGRWWAPDKLANEYTSYSPYNFALNNPILLKDADGNIVVDGDGNPVYKSGGIHPEAQKNGNTNYYEWRTYYTNEGREIKTKTLVGIIDAKGVAMEVKTSQLYNCNGYTQFASIDNVNNPDDSKYKTDLGSEYTNYSTGEVTKNMENILADDYTSLGYDLASAREKANAGEKVIGVWNHSTGPDVGKVGHSAIVGANNPEWGPFNSKNGPSPFLRLEDGSPMPYAGDRMAGPWINPDTEKQETFEFGGYYLYKGNKTIDIKTVGGKTNMTDYQLKSKINEK